MDVFSAAVTLAYAGQGRTVWQSNSELQLMRSINEDEPDLSGLTDLQRNFLLPLLNKDISERPTSESAYEMTLNLIENYGRKEHLKALSGWTHKSKIKEKKKRGTLFYIGNSIVGFFLLMGLLMSGTRIYSFFDSLNDNPPKTVNTSTPESHNSSLSSANRDVTIGPSPTLKDTASPQASKTPTLKPVTTNPTPKPVTTSSGSFKESPAEAKNVVISNIFGRSFETNGGLDWSVPLTNSSSEPVPPITNLQFRLIGHPNKTWLDVGYKLKVGNFGVQAIVDKLFFDMLFKKNVCPEFRFVKVEDNLVVEIWNPGTPECATDYNP